MLISISEVYLDGAMFMVMKFVSVRCSKDAFYIGPVSLTF